MDPVDGKLTFERYVEDYWWPSRQLEVSTRAAYRSYLDKHFIPLDFHVRVHDLRHAHASWLLAGGADLRAVMERMGHSQVTTTQRYLHTLPDADDQALAAFERVRHRRLPRPVDSTLTRPRPEDAPGPVDDERASPPRAKDLRRGLQ